MSLLTKKEFCVLTGLKPRQISIYVGRGKIFLSGDLIDESVQQNAEFIKQRAELMANKVPTGTINTKTTKEHKLVSPNYANIKVPKHKAHTDSHGEKTPLVELERIQKGLTIEKTIEEVEKLRLHNAKAAGESIPIDVVKVVVAQLAKGFITSFQNGSENFLIEISKKVGMDRVMLADSKGKLFKTINESINKAVDESKKQISDIVKEYAIKKEPGEKE